MTRPGTTSRLDLNLVFDGHAWVPRDEWKATMGEEQELRERIADAIAAFFGPDDSPHDAADAVLSLLKEERRDVNEHVTDVGKGVIDTWPTYDDLRAERDLLRRMLEVAPEDVQHVVRECESLREREAVLLGIIRRYREGWKPLIRRRRPGEWVQPLQWDDATSQQYQPVEPMSDAEAAVFAEVSE